MASIERNKIVKYCIKLMYLFVFYEYTDHILDMVNNNDSGFNIIPPRIKLNTRFAHNMYIAQVICIYGYIYKSHPIYNNPQNPPNPRTKTRILHR